MKIYYQVLNNTNVVLLDEGVRKRIAFAPSEGIARDNPRSSKQRTSWLNPITPQQPENFDNCSSSFSCTDRVLYCKPDP